jgi:DNA-binding MarR family transcriptional regulator
MTEESTQSERAARLVETMARYGRLAHSLRIARLGHHSFWIDLPLTLPQLKALGVITAAGPAGRSGRSLAAVLGVGPSAVTPLVDKLVDHGYVTRHEDPIDRRILRVRTTPSGLALLERLNTSQLDELAHVVARIEPSQLPLIEQALAILTTATQELLDEQNAPSTCAADGPAEPRPSLAVS